MFNCYIRRKFLELKVWNLGYLADFARFWRLVPYAKKSLEERNRSKLSVGKVLRYRRHPIGMGLPKVAALLLSLLVALIWMQCTE